MKIAFYIVNILAGLLLLCWPIAAFTSLFLFDAPGSESNPLALGLAFSIFIYPVVVLRGIKGFWKSRNSQDMVILTRYTMLSLSGPLLILLFGMLLNIICGGEFACID
jgi:hypothetical protein